jgi:protoporphyrin/coproporphyrin ferrochelatase
VGEVPAAIHDAVLLIAFGGPTRPEEIRPFLDGVLRGRPTPRDRYEEVVRHYQAVGGCSPLQRLTLRQAEGLGDLLRREGPDLPVYVGMRHSKPSIAEAVASMAQGGRKRAVALVLAPHRSEASWDAYVRAVAEARERLGHGSPVVDYVGPWSDHPLFTKAVAARIAEAREGIPRERRAGAALVFTAHSLPVGMPGSEEYASSFSRTADLVSRRLRIATCSLAYQSRSGSPRQPWLEPGITEHLHGLASRGVRDVLLAPIGFVCDNVEVLYDLDIEARAVASDLGLGYFRAGTVGDHPAFLSMMASLVRDAASSR